MIHEETANLRAMHILLGHGRIENVRRVGVDVGDALELAEAIEV